MAPLWAYLSLAAACHALKYVSLSDCAEKGWVVGQLACSTCAEIESALGADDEIVADCQSCCSPAVDFASSRRYDSAIMKACQARLQSYGGVNEWFEKSALKWAAEVSVEDDCSFEGVQLTLKDDGADASKASKASSRSRSRGVPPSGPRSDASSISLPIGSWKIEHIDGFLKAKLRGQE